MVERHKVTNFTGVPFMMFSIIENRNRKNYNISSLRFICFGGAPTPKGKIMELINEFPYIDFIHMYGQTETSTRISHLLPKDSKNKAGSIGKPIPGMEWRIVNPNGDDVPVGTEGEIIVNGKNVMKGYYRRDEETANVLKNGWLHTGDLAKFDKDGFAYITGRIKNKIIKGGMNIYPEEIEEYLILHPLVKESYVFGVDHPYYGEVLNAKIVLQRDCDVITEDELINFCCKGLPFYKVPDKIEVVTELPKTESGKLRRY